MSALCAHARTRAQPAGIYAGIYRSLHSLPPFLSPFFAELYYKSTRTAKKPLGEGRFKSLGNGGSLVVV